MTAKIFYLKYVDQIDDSWELRCETCDGHLIYLEPGTKWEAIREIILKHDCYKKEGG